MAVPPELIQRTKELARLHEAQEKVRRQQQGHGKPIISAVSGKFRVVAVGKTIHWSQNWLVFPDFLLFFLTKTLGHEWGMREKSKDQHPIFRWLEKFKRYSDSLPKEGRLQSGPMMGFVACWQHLGYALYLIAHNDKIPKQLLKRLRDPTTFMPAYYEALVGAALAVAGFEISSAEIKATSTPVPEFRATSKKTGTVYEVEAKRKERWTTLTEDVSNADFQHELEAYVRDQVYASSRKKLTNPIYWFELSIPTRISEADWHVIASKVETTIRNAEKSMTVKSQPLTPAFVAISNHTYLANEDIEGQLSFGSLFTIRIDDYPFGRSVEIEAILEAYDKYRDIFWMMDAWKIASNVPITFDGTPEELLSPDGVSNKTVKIGDNLITRGKDGKEITAQVEDITSINDRQAIVALYAPATNCRWLAKLPLSESEAKAAAHYTDAIFGKPNVQRRLRESDPLDLYDWFLKGCSKMTAEKITEALDANDHLRQFRDLPLKEARICLAREYTKATWARHKARQSSTTSKPGDGESLSDKTKDVTDS